MIDMPNRTMIRPSHSIPKLTLKPFHSCFYRASEKLGRFFSLAQTPLLKGHQNSLCKPNPKGKQFIFIHSSEPSDSSAFHLPSLPNWLKSLSFFDFLNLPLIVFGSYFYRSVFFLGSVAVYFSIGVVMNRASSIILFLKNEAVCIRAFSANLLSLSCFAKTKHFFWLFLSALSANFDHKSIMNLNHAEAI